SSWFKEIFETRVTKGHARAAHFSTTDGGGIYATSFGGSVTGFGGDVIIIDDPHDIEDASHPERLAHTNEQYYTKIARRLNNRKTGRTLVIAHRIHENDLSANLLKDGGWQHIALPIIAPRDQTYETAYGPWKRKKGELLRADGDDVEEIEALRHKE